MLAHFDISQIALDDPLTALLIGAVVGFIHVFIGADHLAAVMPMSVNRKLRAAWVGVRWGFGHSMGVMLVAILLLVAQELTGMTPTGDWAEKWGNVAVGAMLVLLGAWGVWQAVRHKLHVHTHTHDGEDGPEGHHTHMHVHRPGEQGHVHSHAAYAVGTLHGMVGVAHVLAVLPALLAPTRAASFGYLGGFMVGTVVALALFAALFGLVTAKLGERSPKFVKGSMYFAALACVAVGLGFIVVAVFDLHLFHHHH